MRFELDQLPSPMGSMAPWQLGELGGTCRGVSLSMTACSAPKWSYSLSPSGSGFFSPPVQLQRWNFPHATFSSCAHLEKCLTLNNVIWRSWDLSRMLLQTSCSEAALTIAIHPLHPSRAPFLCCHIQHGPHIFTFRRPWLCNPHANHVSHCSNIHSLAVLNLTLNAIIKAKRFSCF